MIQRGSCDHRAIVIAYTVIQSPLSNGRHYLSNEDGFDSMHDAYSSPNRTRQLCEPIVEVCIPACRCVQYMKSGLYAMFFQLVVCLCCLRRALYMHPNQFPATEIGFEI